MCKQSCRVCHPLSEADQRYLRRSVSDLSDIPLIEQARIERGFRAAAERAEQVRLGLRSALFS